MRNSVCLIVTTYNRAAMLRRCLSSIEMQTVRPEVIVIDDHSAVPAEAPKWVRLYRTEKNVGQAECWRRAILLTDAEWVMFFDDDNYFVENDIIESAIQDWGEDVGIIQGGDFCGGLARLPLVEGKVSGRDWLWMVKKHFTFFFFRRKYAVDFPDIKSADMYLAIRIGFPRNVVLIQRPFAVWEQHSRNASRNVTTKDLWRNRVFFKGIKLRWRLYMEFHYLFAIGKLWIGAR